MIDDKDLAMICITILGIGAMFVFKDPSIIIGAITALGALATGRKKGE